MGPCLGECSISGVGTIQAPLIVGGLGWWFGI